MTPAGDLTLDLRTVRGTSVAQLRIVATGESSGQPSIIRISREEAREWGEDAIQLLEQRSYEYELSGHPAGTRLRPGMFRSSRLPQGAVERGLVTPGSNTGSLPIVLEREDGTLLATASIEVRSVKIDYRTDYRTMLEYIADFCMELLIELRSPATQRVDPDPARDPSAVAQQLAFLQGLLGRREFRDALHRIVSLPHTSTERGAALKDIRQGLRSTINAGQQLASRQPRYSLSPLNPLSERLPTLPATVKSTERQKTPDSSENRFVKHALSQFSGFLRRMEGQLVRSGKTENVRLMTNLRSLRLPLDEVLASPVFASVGQARTVPFSSPVLQRRSGYQEVYRAWLMFNLAAQLRWSGGDDVYDIGKRNVANLYEYWLFFRLLDHFRHKFSLPKTELRNLVEKTSDGFSMKLKSGKHISILGRFTHFGRVLNIRFSYNRTFTRQDCGEGKVNYPSSGSWTQPMRPDYTLSAWPADFGSEEQAERCELMVHLHFDAKYRVDRITEFFGDGTVGELDAAQLARREGRPTKRDDLLKMHAYRDAIRRSAGAYVLYPGTETQRWRGFHEILPNLGAFAIRPGDEGGLLELSTFLDEVLQHLSDRASRRERQSFDLFKVQSAPISVPMYEVWPERTAEGARMPPPADIFAVVGKKSSNFIMVDKWVFIRIQDGRPLSPHFMNASLVVCLSADSSLAGETIQVECPPGILLAEDVHQRMGSSSIQLSGAYLCYNVVAKVEFDLGFYDRVSKSIDVSTEAEPWPLVVNAGFGNKNP